MIDLKEGVSAEGVNFTGDAATYRPWIETGDRGRNRNAFITHNHVNVPQLPNVPGRNFFAYSLKCFFQLRSKHCTILYVANAVRSPFIISEKFFFGLNLPAGAGPVVPLVNRRRYVNLVRGLKVRDTMQTVANHFNLRLQLRFISQLLKVAAAAASEVRTRRLNTDGGRL